MGLGLQFELRQQYTVERKEVRIRVRVISIFQTFSESGHRTEDVETKMQ